MGKWDCSTFTQAHERKTSLSQTHKLLLIIFLEPFFVSFCLLSAKKKTRTTTSSSVRRRAHLGVAIRRRLHPLHLVGDDGLEGSHLAHAGLQLRVLAVLLLPVEGVGMPER